MDFFPIERAMSLETEGQEEVTAMIFKKLKDIEVASHAQADVQDKVAKEYVLCELVN